MNTLWLLRGEGEMVSSAPPLREAVIAEPSPNEASSMFGERIEEACQDLGLSRTRLCVKAGVTPSTVSRVYKDGDLGYLACVALAQTLGVNFDWLVAGEGEKRPLKALENPDPVGFALRLEEAMKKAKISAPTLSNQAGLSGGVVRTYLTGREPGRKNLLAIARALGLRPDWLATGRGSPARAAVRSKE